MTTFPSSGTWTKVAAGGSHACAISSAGAAYCHGGNWHGQLGDGGSTTRSVPTAVTIPQGVSSWGQVSAGVFHTCAVATGGGGFCWGYNAQGQLGVGDNTAYNVPKALHASSGVTAWSQISAGGSSSCGIAADTSAYCWGASWEFHLGGASVLRRGGAPFTQNSPL